MSSAASHRMSPAEYLTIERAADCKSEFYGGELFAMAGGSRLHNLIAGNVARHLGNQLEQRPREVYPSDMRVKVSASGLYTYPDVVVVCGEPQFEDDEVDTLLNPTLIVEVLSRTTEAYDRGEKFDHYRRLPSLEGYILIAQDQYRVERYLRQSGSEEWILTSFSDPQNTVPLSPIGCELTLAQIYLKVRFPDGPRALRGAGS